MADCPRASEHTPCPEGYMAWHNWARDMHRRGYRQRRCPGCGLFKVWVRLKEE